MVRSRTRLYTHNNVMIPPKRRSAGKKIRNRFISTHTHRINTSNINNIIIIIVAQAGIYFKLGELTNLMKLTNSLTPENGDLPNSKVGHSLLSFGAHSLETHDQFVRFYQFLLNVSIVTKWTLFIVPILAILWIPKIIGLTVSS